MFSLNIPAARFKDEKVSDIILNWSLGKEKILNIISPPYGSSKIFIETMIAFAVRRKKVLYLTEEKEDYIEVLNYLRRNTTFRDYSYLRKNIVEFKSSIIISNYINAVKLKEKFDLVIYDDIRSFPQYNNYEIMDLMRKCVKDTGKLIAYSIESIFKNQRDMILPARKNKIPLIEPRIVITRININKDIPYVIYDYMKWSMASNRKIVIYVPESEKINIVYEYLINIRESLTSNIICYSKDESDEKTLNKFMIVKRGIIITDDFNDIYSELKEVDVMVYFTDDKIFDYKKLVYFCGKVGRSDELHRGEVIFLANENTEDMDRAKDIARYFNKEAWELSLLEI